MEVLQVLYMYKYPKRKIESWLRYYFAKLPTKAKLLSRPLGNLIIFAL